MIQVLVLLQNANTKAAQLLSEVRIVNDGTGDFGGVYGNYDVELIRDDRPRLRCRVEDFRRELGAEALLMEALMTLNESDDLEGPMEPPYAPTV